MMKYPPKNQTIELGEPDSYLHSAKKDVDNILSTINYIKRKNHGLSPKYIWIYRSAFTNFEQLSNHVTKISELFRGSSIRLKLIKSPKKIKKGNRLLWSRILKIIER